MVVPGGAMVPTGGRHDGRGAPDPPPPRDPARADGDVCSTQAAERGEAMASLFASQGGDLGRFGFGHAAHHLEFDIALDHLTWADGTEPTGRVTLYPRAEALPIMRRIYEQAIEGRPAALEVNDAWMDVGFWESKKDDERVFSRPRRRRRHAGRIRDVRDPSTNGRAVSRAPRRR